MFHTNRLRLYVLCLLVLLVACQPAAPASKPAAEFSSEVATRWFELQLKLSKETPGFTPPVVARAFGYSGITLYESIVGGMQGYNSLVGQLNALASLPQREADQTYHWSAAANSALATILRDLYPTATPENLAAVDALEAQYAAHYASEAGEEVFNRSSIYGEAIANAIFEWSKDDGGHEGYMRNFPENYTPLAVRDYGFPRHPATVARCNQPGVTIDRL